jgi:hypothetical protein
MDVISLQIEIEYKRCQYIAVKRDAGVLILRANMIDEDKWLMYYHLMRGHYFAYTHFHLGEKLVAKWNFVCALVAYHHLCLIKEFSIFNAEEIIMGSFLKMIHGEQAVLTTGLNISCRAMRPVAIHFVMRWQCPNTQHMSSQMFYRKAIRIGYEIKQATISLFQPMSWSCGGCGCILSLGATKMDRSIRKSNEAVRGSNQCGLYEGVVSEFCRSSLVLEVYSDKRHRVL